MNCHLLSDSNRIIPSSSGYGRPTFQSIECYCNSCTGRLSSNWCFWNKGVLFSARITNEVSSSGTDLRSVHSVNPFSFGTNSLFILATVCDKPMKNKSTNMIPTQWFLFVYILPSSRWKCHYSQRRKMRRLSTSTRSILSIKNRTQLSLGSQTIQKITYVSSRKYGSLIKF